MLGPSYAKYRAIQQVEIQTKIEAQYLQCPWRKERLHSAITALFHVARRWCPVSDAAAVTERNQCRAGGHLHCAIYHRLARRMNK